MKKNKNIIKKILEAGLKDSILNIYFNRILKPYMKYFIRKKYSNRKEIFSDEKLLSSLSLSKFENTNFKFTSKKNTHSTPQDIIIDYFASRISPKFFDSINGKNDFANVYKEEQAETTKKANLVLDNNLQWVTPRCPKFNDQINWHSTFNGEQSWSMDFSMDLDYSSDKRPGDVREVWEINRHQFFITLGKAYFITGDEKYSKKFFELLNDWIGKNPCGYGINWLHSQETGIRILSWIWAYHFFKDSPLFSDEIKVIFFKSLYQHVEFTYLTLSRGIITHNHLVSEICGLLVFSIMFPEFKKSNRWFKSSFKIFKREVLKQIWESGPSGELSTNYHLFVLDSFIQMFVLLKLNGYDIPQPISERIEKMIEYASYFIRPDGTIPKIGDNDSGRTFKLSEYDENDRRYYLCVGAALFNRSDFKSLNPKFNEEAFWLLGINGMDKFESIPKADQVCKSRYFEPTGFAIFRDGFDLDSTHLIFRGGTSAYRRNVSTSHNHADFLSFELYKNGHAFFIDPGTYLYSKDDRWRFYYRKTSSHNTISINNTDSVNVTFSRFGIPFLPLSKLNAVETKDNFDFIDMQHSGYSNIGITHQRKLLFMKKHFIMIVDIVSGVGKYEIIQNYNLGNSRINYELKNKEFLLSCADNLHAVKFIPLGIEVDKHTITKGNIDPVDGWFSSRYGTKSSASILRFRSEKELPIISAAIVNLRSNVPINIHNYELNSEFQKITISHGIHSFSIKFSVTGKSEINTQ